MFYRRHSHIFIHHRRFPELIFISMLWSTCSHYQPTHTLLATDTNEFIAHEFLVISKNLSSQPMTQTPNPSIPIALIFATAIIRCCLIDNAIYIIYIYICYICMVDDFDIAWRRSTAAYHDFWPRCALSYRQRQSST